MKNIFCYAFVSLIITASLSSCTNDDMEISGEGNLVLEFDNSFKENDLILETQDNTTDNNEVLKINKIKYIISNVVLTKTDGTTYSYPKAESYFIANEDSETGHEFELSNIPAGDYVKIKYGIGVDKAQWELGAEGQGDFLAVAQEESMLWNWTAGYKFIAFEGTFTSETVTTPAIFKIHTGQTGTDYNYTEVTLDLPTKALIRTNITPEVHIVADLSKILDGPNTIKLTDYNQNDTGATIMGGAALPLITENVATMFRVDHVHND